MTAAIGRVNEIIGEISRASAEQHSGIGQVAQAVSQLDEGTQQNAALVEQSTAAAENLRQQAQLLVQAVASFKLQDVPVASVAPAAHEPSAVVTA